MKGYMYILECSDKSYYTGSTKYLDLRLAQHQAGVGSNHTKKRLPVKLIYFEEYHRIDKAFYREKQVQGWSRKKKEALINGWPEELKKLAECMNDSHYKNRPFGFAQGPIGFAQGPVGFAQGPIGSAQSPDDSAELHIDFAQGPYDSVEGHVNSNESPVDPAKAPDNSTKGSEDSEEPYINSAQEPTDPAG